MLTAKQRKELPEAAFGWPQKRLFAVTSQDDADAAARLLGAAPESERAGIRARVLAICKAKGFRPPPAWTGDAPMSQPEPTAEFAVEPGGEDLGGMVRRKAPVIFDAGDGEGFDFPGRGRWHISPEEIMAAVADFSPVEIDDNHRPTHGPDGRPANPSYFKGKLGRVTKLTPKDDFTGFGGEVEVPLWLHKLHPGKPLPLSVTFDWHTKRIKNVAVTPSPRVEGAAAFTQPELYAAFAAACASGDPSAKATTVPPGPPACPRCAEADARAAAAEPSGRERKLEADLAAERARRFASEAVAFAQTLGTRTVPAQGPRLVNLYRGLAALEASGDAAFARAAGLGEGVSLLGELKALLADAPPHGLSAEKVPGRDALFALPPRGTGPGDEAAERRRQADAVLASTPAGRKILADRAAHNGAK